MQSSGNREIIDVVPGTQGQRPGLPPSRHPAEDQPRIAGKAHLGPHTKALHHPRAIALDQAIGPLDQVEQQRAMPVILEVEVRD